MKLNENEAVMEAALELVRQIDLALRDANPEAFNADEAAETASQRAQAAIAAANE